MSAGNYDINLEQGSDYTITLTIKDSSGTAIDLTSHTANMYFSADRDSSLDLTLTESAGLTLGGTAGTVVIVLTDVQVDAFTWSKGQYDLITLDAAGLKTRRLTGAVYISEEVPTA